MKDANAVVNLNARGLKQAVRVLGVFGPIRKTGFFNVLLLKADDVPGMLESLKEIMARDPGSLAFLARIIPVSHTFTFQTPEEFEKKAIEMVIEWVDALEGKSFHVRMRRRGFKGKMSGMDEEQFLDRLLLDALEEKGSPGRITFHNPDAIIAIETVGQWAGLSLWLREDLERYPFVKLD
ncbi:MAG: THUMP domain-containing protein [Candidatus Sulfobium sp.]|jgi:tRNA(Ser,Leu) C12 N-acetylase TAN1